MAETPPTVFVDTNVWISGFINPFGAPGRVLEAFREGRFVPVVSGALLREIREVLARPRIYRRWQVRRGDVDNTLSLLEDRAVHVIPIGNVHLCRDPDDDILLETAPVGGARYFVSRDDDLKRDQELMALLEARGVGVLSVAQFLDLLANHSIRSLVNPAITITQKQLPEFLLHVAPSRPVFILGQPGVGKTSLVRQFAELVGCPASPCSAPSSPRRTSSASGRSRMAPATSARPAFSCAKSRSACSSTSSTAPRPRSRRR